MREISPFVVIVVKRRAPRNLANIAEDLANVYDARKITLDLFLDSRAT